MSLPPLNRHDVVMVSHPDSRGATPFRGSQRPGTPTQPGLEAGHQDAYDGRGAQPIVEWLPAVIRGSDMPDKATFTMTTCPHCGGSTPIVADFCANCGAPNESGQAVNAALAIAWESTVAKARLPENTRAIDLEPETIRAFREEMLEPLKRGGQEFGVNVLDLEVGNIGRHAGQFVTATVTAPADAVRSAKVRDAAVALMLANFGGDPDMVSVRVEFIDEHGRRLARAVTDTTDCTEIMTNDAHVMTEFARTHTRME